MKSWGARAQRLRVPLGTLLGVVFLLLMHPSVHSLWIGGVVAALGSLLRLWAAGHLEKGKRLARAGPYAHTRNPLYLGSFLMALGIVLAGQAYWLLLPFGLFFGAFYYPVMRREEQELFEGYGDQFTEYARRVPLFFPGLTAAADHSSQFRWARVLTNREHHTMMGLALTVAFLFLRTRWP
jgi:protein-S-isoprenylcysteine O-methyltransferase Ste14